MNSYSSIAGRSALLMALVGLVTAGIFIINSSVLRADGHGPKGVDKQQMLSPASLKGETRAATVEEIRQHFTDPPAQYRTIPLWVWNDEMEPGRMMEQLRQYKEQGMGGTFVHPRPGLVTEYLGDEWFDLWRLALDESKRLGMLCNIYDENSYPSGFAGGHVPSRAPDTAVQYVQAELVNATKEVVGWTFAASPNILAIFKIERDEKGRVAAATRIPEKDYRGARGPLAIFRLRRAAGSPWTGQFPYVDLTNPNTGRIFLETTYDAYKKRFGDDFGQTIKWGFDDEPLLATAGAYDLGELSLPMSYYILAEFQTRNGYDLREEMASLYWDIGLWQKVRFDYWQTLHDLWKENYFAPIFQWCERNHLQFTGHFMEHTWPNPLISPDDASLYPFLHTPGIDMLIGTGLRTVGQDPHMLFTIRQLSSVTHQLGRRAFSETYGAAGWDSTFEHYKRMADWLIVHGVTVIDQHLSFTTIRGARKRDHPQSFSDVAAWWPYYHLHADHTARLCYVMAQGVAPNRLLVLEPTTSGFLWARQDGETKELQQLKESYDALNQFLADHQVDFDLGDEYMLEWFGEVQSKQLVIGKAAYDLVVWPQNMSNLRHQTLPLLEKYLDAGGIILALDEPAAYVDGRPSEVVRRLQARFPNQWRRVSGPQELLAEVQRRLLPLVTFDKDLPAGIGHRMETLQDGHVVHFFTNSNSSPVSAEARLEGTALEEWDTVSGQFSPVATQSPAPGKVEFTLDLPPVGSRLILVSNQPAGATALSPRKPPRYQSLVTSDWKVSATSPNVLVMDYCDLQLQGKSYPDINTWKANWLIWQGHGFERPAWDNAVQFKRRLLDLPPFPADSGFEAIFNFQVADAEALTGAELALECPELYQVHVNGQPLDTRGGKPWLDPHLKSIEVEKLLRAGENTVRLVASPFNIRMELENIYLRGSFAVAAYQRGFTVRKAQPLQVGSWAQQGYPFYSESTLYEAKVEVPKSTKQIRVQVPQWAGSVIEVLLDGKRVQVLGWQPYVCEANVTPGSHTVAVRVMATPRSLFGPFHNPQKQRMIAWPGFWTEFPEHQPAGAQYDLLDYGLLEPFVVEAVH
jgi:hypothetical protein